MSARVITSGDHVGQVVDEIDPAGLDLLVQAGASQVLGHRLPASHGGGRQIWIERPPVVPLGGRIHLQKAGYGAVGLVRDGDSHVPVALTLRVAVVGQKSSVAGELEDLVVAARHPVPPIGLRPRDGAGCVQLMGDVGEAVDVVRTVPVEVDGILLVPDSCHQRSPLSVPVFSE